MNPLTWMSYELVIPTMDTDTRHCIQQLQAHTSQLKHWLDHDRGKNVHQIGSERGLLLDEFDYYHAQMNPVCMLVGLAVYCLVTAHTITGRDQKETMKRRLHCYHLYCYAMRMAQTCGYIPLVQKSAYNKYGEMRYDVVWYRRVPDDTPNPEPCYCIPAKLLKS